MWPIFSFRLNADGGRYETEKNLSHCYILGVVNFIVVVFVLSMSVSQALPCTSAEAAYGKQLFCREYTLSA